jgi:flagellar hook-associated protein 2
MIGEFARALGSTLDSALGSGGAISARTDGIQTAMQRLSDQQARVEARLSAVEARYRAQFAALDGLVSRMNATNSFLTSQLASINGNPRR